MLAERIKELVEAGSLEVVKDTKELTKYVGLETTYLKCKSQRLRKVKDEPTQVKFGYCVLPRKLRMVELENGEKVKMKFHIDCSEGLEISQLKN